MDFLILQKFSLFIFNTNVREVKNIYAGKVNNDMFNHLVSMANDILEKYENNSSAWLNYILNLDEDNLQILYNHIESEF